MGDHFTEIQKLLQTRHKSGVFMARCVIWCNQGIQYLVGLRKLR